MCNGVCVIMYKHMYNVNCISIFFPFYFRFIQEINDRINMLEGSVDKGDRSYLDNTVFKREHDEQLLLWMQRYLY